MIIKDYKFLASKSSGDVSAILIQPQSATHLYIFAHGAGASMIHQSMQSYSEALADQNIASLRFNFPYTEQGKKSISPKPILYSTIRSAFDFADSIASGLPMIAGGKSMGGRMTSTVLSELADDRIKGLVFFGFPLHAPGKDSLERADHLFNVTKPMLFLQGERDKLAKPDLMKELDHKLGKQSTLVLFPFADHSHKVPKKSGKTNEELQIELAKSTRSWLNNLI